MLRWAPALRFASQGLRGDDEARRFASMAGLEKSTPIFNGCFWFHLYTSYILPSGGLYATFHLLGEPEKTIDIL